MSTSYYSYLYVGFELPIPSLWTLEDLPKPLCDKGHEQAAPGDPGPFCPQDGTRFRVRQTKRPSSVFKALASHFAWTGSDYDKILESLMEDDGESGNACLKSVNSMLPALKGSEITALVRMVASTSSWRDRHRETSASVGAPDILLVVDTFREAARAAGLHVEPRIYLVGHCSG